MKIAVPTITKARISIQVHESAEKTELFKERVDLQISKPEIFKFAVMMGEVPKWVRESDYTYLQSKIPYYAGLYSDFIELQQHSIINLSEDDRWKKLISETIGVAVGLRYATKLLKTRLSKFKKIPPPAEGKYLDYSVIADGKQYDIETKGTVSDSLSAMTKDILDKKAASASTAYLRFGTIVQLKSSAEETRQSRCLIVDDPPDEDNTQNQEYDVRDTVLQNYGIFLSYILDSKYYNRFIRPVLDKRVNRRRIQENKFFGLYHFEGREYLGEYFDYRLIEGNVRAAATGGESQTVSTVFKKVTARIGRTKFFMGVEKRIILAINKEDYGFLNNYYTPEILNIDGPNYEFLDNDGILIVKAVDGSNGQIEQIFTEKVVEERIGLYTSYLAGIAHRCGAPCRSPQKRGEACAKLTYRAHCHWHR